jgi:hypothetical protein
MTWFDGLGYANLARKSSALAQWLVCRLDFR